MADVRGNLLPIYFVADESFSMQDHMGDLNRGLSALLDALNLETFAAAKVRLAVVGFADDAICHLGMSDLREVSAMPNLSARGGTSYGAAFAFLRSAIPADCDALKASGYQVHRPAVFFLTDGQPTDNNWEQALRDLTNEGFREHPNILAFGIGQAVASTIVQIATREEYAFIAAADTDTGVAIAKFVDALTHSVVNSGQALAGGRAELVSEKPEGFSMAVDLI